ncbi:GntR family transcriptional regulator [Cupriavidus gilardii]|uniref:GntR family transcriptional regulator n=1 Tax=Cupriavidus gilardii TaxID=82541 RepID=A0ABY4VPC6_9BURK|nr:GntR family transcriptional regulator [Cupriavidus gilardii]USE77879.1 GntR family transcriptional regulator [Cupriavidus gilardii]
MQTLGKPARAATIKAPTKASPKTALERTGAAPPKATPAAVAAGPRRSVADQVYDGLKRDIGQFRLVPGDRFTELELCARLGVSRTPVRQALVRLQQEGYVEVLFRSGWRVLPFDFDRYEQLYDLRMVLETTAAQRLCTEPAVCGNAVDRARLERLTAIWLVEPARRSTDGAQVRQWDEEFHCALVEAAGNAEMARVHRDITERIRMVRSLDFTKSFRIEATYEEHAQILRAILAKRADQATMLLRAHIGSSQAEVRKITLHQLHLARHQGGAAGDGLT